jgi:lipoate-protein ligase A
MSVFSRLESASLAAECLARERSLHEIAESDGSEYVWVWEVEMHSVVMGRSADCVSEIHHEACERAGVPILRRESGGRTVLLGKGCLNYTLILRYDGQGIHESYRLILDAVLDAAGVPGARVESTDLTVRNRKFAGCAQRRRRRTVLHHGTILYDFDIATATRFLAEPKRQPTYRDGRPHADFLTNVDLHPNFSQRLAARFPEAAVIS